MTSSSVADFAGRRVYQKCSRTKPDCGDFMLCSAGTLGDRSCVCDDDHVPRLDGACGKYISTEGDITACNTQCRAGVGGWGEWGSGRNIMMCSTGTLGDRACVCDDDHVPRL